MPVNTAIVVAIFILGFTAIAMIIFLASRRRQALEQKMKQAASSRGWNFAARGESGTRIRRWTGSTEGITWTAESISATTKGDRRRRRQHVARWQGEFNLGISGPIVLMGVPKGKELPSFATAEGDGFFATLAKKAAGFALDTALDAYFGRDAGAQVDAASLHRVNAPGLTGFIAMGVNKEQGPQLLAQGLESALNAATNDPASVLSQEDRPWILLRPHGISLARMEQFADVAELEAFIRAGVALTRTFTFGRRLPS
jgi:hypothetical protein